MIGKSTETICFRYIYQDQKNKKATYYVSRAGNMNRVFIFLAVFIIIMFYSQNIDATIDIYSGLPNPSWSLTTPEKQTLDLILQKLDEYPFDKAPNTEILGYRGMYLSIKVAGLQIKKIHVYKDIVTVSTSGKGLLYGKSTYYDPSREVEKWLLTSFTPHTDKLSYDNLWNLIMEDN